MGEASYAILDQFEGQQGATIDALQVVQAHFGYISEESIDEIAAVLGVSRNTVFGVASYYEFFHLEPPATYTIRYCMGTVCDALGGRAILDEVSRILDVRVGETSDDGRWMLERLPCFGTCARAPMMQINDQAYCKLSVESVREILTSGELPAGDRGPIAGDGRPAPSREEIEA